MTEDQKKELFAQLARQQEQESKQCTVVVWSIPDEYFEREYGKTRAVVKIYVRESVAKELTEKY